MDWSALVTQVIVTGGALGTAWLTLRGKLAEIAKTGTEARTDAAAARAASEKTESSINHDPQTITKRLSDMKDSLAAHGKILANVQSGQESQGEVLARIKEIQAEQGRDISGLRKDDGELRGQIRNQREELQNHLVQSDQAMRVIARIEPIVDRLNPDK